jgi:hypothetical protein
MTDALSAGETPYGLTMEVSDPFLSRRDIVDPHLLNQAARSFHLHQRRHCFDSIPQVRQVAEPTSSPDSVPNCHNAAVQSANCAEDCNLEMRISACPEDNRLFPTLVNGPVGNQPHVTMTRSYGYLSTETDPPAAWESCAQTRRPHACADQREAAGRSPPAADSPGCRPAPASSATTSCRRKRSSRMGKSSESCTDSVTIRPRPLLHS